MVDNDHTYTSADEWTSDAPDALPSSLQVPSGKTALVRAPGIDTFMRLGMIPNTLLGLIKGALEQNSGKKKTAAQEKREQEKLFENISQDPAKLNDMLTMVDKATVYCVVKPRVRAIPHYNEDVIGTPDEDKLGQEIPIEHRPVPGKGEERWLWVDQVDIEDKMFIFNFACAGTRDAERFRAQSAAVLDRTSHGQSVARTTKRTAGDTRKRAK